MSLSRCKSGWWLAGVLLAAPSSRAEDPAHARDFWAYPRGVIVTAHMTSGAKFGDGPQTRELENIGRLAETPFGDCLSALRDRRPDLATGARVAIGLLAAFGESGALESLEPERQPPPELVECAARAMVAVHGSRLTPLAKPRAVEARLVLDGILLTDQAAKGRGYLFYETKTRWEKVLLTHPNWFHCDKVADCIVAVEGCGPTALNASAATAFREAAAATDLTICRETDPETVGATCRRHRCELQR